MKQIRRVLVLSALAMWLPQPLDAATPKPAKKAAAKPVVPPAAPVEPAGRKGFMVPRAVSLTAPTPAENIANAVWNVRAALNVAALQCQFSRYLATVNNYNDFLKAHSEELSKSQAVLVGHFKRRDGARGANSFDMHTTRTYNSYSTLDAQYAFCDAAGRVGRAALAVPKGKLGTEALRHSPEIRAALSEQPLSPALAIVALAPVAVDPIIVPEG